MLKVMANFNKHVMGMPNPWPLWMMLLIVVNFVAPLFFIGSLEAQVVLVGAITSAALMLTLFARFGYVRILGLGHIPWLFTVPWLWLRLGEMAADGLFFYYWLLAVIILDGISIVIDVIDLIRYGMGERQATVTIEGN
jgi:hypothetical protein